MKELQVETRKKLVDGLISMGVKQENIYNPKTKYWNETIDLSGIKICVVTKTVGGKDIKTETKNFVKFYRGFQFDKDYKDYQEFEIELTDLVQAAICNSSFSDVRDIPYNEHRTSGNEYLGESNK